MGSTAASTASSTTGSVPGWAATSAAIALPRDRSSSPSASAAHVPGSCRTKVSEDSQADPAEVTDVPRVTASSSTKNSSALSPGLCCSASCTTSEAL